MTCKDTIRKVLKEHYGDFESTLEHQYEDKITEELIIESINNRQVWATYNQVILELKHSLKDMLRVKELQYKLTEIGDPHLIMIEALEGIKTYTPELERLYHKIRNF